MAELMGRGQYDRAAARAKRMEAVVPVTAFNVETDRMETRPAPQGEPLTHETAGDVLEIVRLRAEIARKDDLIARYAALLKRNGLWLDG